MAYEPKLTAGPSLQRTEGTKISNWKITGISSSNPSGYVSYSVLRCSKTGKEFREDNGFGAEWVDEDIENGTGGEFKVVGTSPVGVKADLDTGIKAGVRARRIQFLKIRIESDKNELRKLEA